MSTVFLTTFIIGGLVLAGTHYVFGRRAATAVADGAIIVGFALFSYGLVG